MEKETLYGRTGKAVKKYSNNKKHGYGVFIGKTKEYHGEWSEGLPHDRGKLFKGTVVAEHLWWYGKIVDKNPSQDAIGVLSSQDVQKFDEQNRVMEIPGV